jgi:hypothetical protein
MESIQNQKQDLLRKEIEYFLIPLHQIFFQNLDKEYLLRLLIEVKK